MPTMKISRRTVLRGTLGGTAIAFGLPPLEAMFNANGTAYAQGAPLPRRMGIFFWGGGIKQDRWVPTTTGATWTPSLALAPLATAGIKDYVSVLTGMNIKTGNPQGHHAGQGGILSGVPLVVQPKGSAPFKSTFGGPSLDQVAANAIGTASKFKSLEVGVSARVNGGEGTTLHYLSHTGPDSPNPPLYDPAKVFDRMFAGFTPPAVGGAPATPVVDVTLALRKSVMDAVLPDINALRARASAADKVRLDQHLANIRTIENRLTATSAPPPKSCTLPVKPALITDKSNHELIEERTGAMSDLIAVSLACDLTRVFSMMFSGGTNETLFWQVNATDGHHSMTHDEPGDQPLVHACTVFTMQCFAKLLVSLKSVSEGAGNVLDNTVIYASSDVADGKQHSITNYPLLVAGRGGGFLKYPGVHYKSASGENTNLALLSVLKAAGLPLTQFGTGASAVSASLTAIEA
jgi:Protein of unknown function (DUF1552)